MAGLLAPAADHPRCSAAFLGPGQVEREKASEQLLAVEVRGPAVGGQDGGIEALVGLREPRRAGVVEVGQRPLGEVGVREPRRVEPAGPEAVQVAGGFGDGVALGIGRARERERLEAGCRRVARPDSTSRSCVPVPRAHDSWTRDWSTPNV